MGATEETERLRVSAWVGEVLAAARSRTARETALVMAGNGLSAALGFVATVLVSRLLGPVPQ